MSYQGNNCDRCTEERMCPECLLGMLEFEYESAKRKIVECQKAIGNHIQAITFWDLECSQALSKVEEFRALLAESELKRKNELPNSTEQSRLRKTKS